MQDDFEMSFQCIYFMGHSYDGTCCPSNTLSNIFIFYADILMVHHRDHGPTSFFHIYSYISTVNIMVRPIFMFFSLSLSHSLLDANLVWDRE